MKIRIGEYTEEERLVELGSFVIEMDDGTKFRIKAERIGVCSETGRLEILKSGSSVATMAIPMTVTPVVSNKVILG